MIDRSRLGRQHTVKKTPGAREEEKRRNVEQEPGPEENGPRLFYIFTLSV
jgi:hypothetical protein